MSEPVVARVEEAHHPRPNFRRDKDGTVEEYECCAKCYQPWPCDVPALVAEVKELTEERDAAREEWHAYANRAFLAESREQELRARLEALEHD